MTLIAIIAIVSAAVILVLAILNNRQKSRTIVRLMDEKYAASDKAFGDGWDKGSRYVLSLSNENISNIRLHMSNH